MKIKPPSKKAKLQPLVRRGKKVGRNEKCTCGSGKKYKHCCLPKIKANELPPKIKVVEVPEKKFKRTKK